MPSILNFFFIVFKCINATGNYSFFSILIIKNHDIMDNCFTKKLFAKTLIILSKNAFIFDKIIIGFRKYNIANFDARPNAIQKLTMINNHGYYCTPEFELLVNKNHIRFYLFYMIYCMQPFDVGIFQFYKHWYNVTV